jgi:RNA-binding protein YhbY
MDENKKQLNEKDIKVLRTYTSDMADAIRDNEASVIKIALAEKDKREREVVYEQAEGTTTSKTFYVIGGIILIVCALVGSYFLFQKKKINDTPQPIINNIDTFISYDSQIHIDVTNATNSKELIETIDKDLTKNQGLIKGLFLEKKVNNLTELITSNNLFTIIDASIPGTLARSLADNFLIGKYFKKNNEPALFLIFQINNYTQAYASTLEWEKTMLKDLFVLFKIDTPMVDGKENPIFEKQWKDVIINNRDARVLYGENGEGILYYVFVNKDKLLITNNIEAMKEVIARLITKNTKPL